MTARFYILTLLAAAVLAGMYVYQEKQSQEVAVFDEEMTFDGSALSLAASAPRKRKGKKDTTKEVAKEDEEDENSGSEDEDEDEGEREKKVPSLSSKNKTTKTKPKSKKDKGPKKNSTSKGKPKQSNRTVELDDVETKESVSEAEQTFSSGYQKIYYRPLEGQVLTSNVSFNLTVKPYKCFVYPNCSFGQTGRSAQLGSNTIVGLINTLQGQLKSNNESNQTQFYSWNKVNGTLFYPANVNQQCEYTPSVHGVMCVFNYAGKLAAFAIASIVALFMAVFV